MTLSTKTVVIVGASRGIGACLAREYAARGYHLGLLARSEGPLEALAAELAGVHNVRVETATLDVADGDAVAPALETLMARLGTVDLVIANAGVLGWRRAGDGNIAEDRRIIQTNLMGAIAVIDAAVAFFKRQGRGHIAGVSSLSAYRGIPGSGAYSASKAALTNYLEALRMEISSKGIAVSIVHPGFVNTDISPGMEKYPFVATPEKVAKEIADGLEKKRKNIVVPRFPWAALMPAMRLLPDSVMKKVF
ncbi:MAG: SDR family NAD(P)-dependent oxidoreductase [Moraxellaceae bacterium]|nr:SDR family NAD(P)-dependent oxidoreductase [Moraxellaceae bacterium]